MIHHIDDRVWWGDKPSVSETVALHKQGMGQIGAIVNVASSLRSPYWSELGRLSWEVWYFRLACPDRKEPSVHYLRGLGLIADAINHAEKFPVLCHCRMGRHRGPTAALFVFWHLAGRTRESLEDGIIRIRQKSPRFNELRPGAVYMRTVLDYCRRNSG